ncbi:hypothetical protein NUU61_004055 [Penicillium alfredii]|uniref:Stress response protein Rds1 n=1 Tax=Penicillium alfredii TaxID=1506179 RepID=A0A9W9KDJ7_9EURO|nr:uncharacterized protein NUU61_004055 [Penicillium alfredii]KAJ5101833.1 hypothetical protein NUU61_004055 [Penicillium alfredii]
MTWQSLLVLGVLGSLPLASSVPAEILARATSAAPTRSHPTSQPHTSFIGTPTTTGALTASSVGSGIPTGSVAPAATSYPSDGKLHSAQPAPFVPAGGVGTNGTIPVYNAKSDFDYESLALALYQEWVELDLFQDALRRFSEADFMAAGLTTDDRELIAFMAQQEVGHATMLSNILGSSAPQQCSYVYPYTSVQEFIDFAQKVTRAGEAGANGFLAHLDSREAAILLTQTLTTESRQQLIFRQFEGLFPMTEWFEVGIPQSWAWTLLAPLISSCPKNQTRLAWQNFPGLRILNQPSPSSASNGNNATGLNQTTLPGVNSARIPRVSGVAASRANATSAAGAQCSPAVATRRPSPLSFPGRQVALQWEAPGKPVGPNNSYITTTQARGAKYVVWVSQLNVTYTPLRVNGNGNATTGNTTNGNATNGNLTSGFTTQPDLETFQGDPAVNGTLFIAITDDDPFLTPFNLSLINTHVVAGPALYQAG